MKTASLLALAALALCPLASATAGEAPAADAGTLPAANNAFALDMYRELAESSGNVFFSPYSISVALWMTYAGARTETAAQMKRVLHLESGNLQPYRGLAKALEPPLVGDTHPRDEKQVAAYQLSVANALWGQEGYPIQAGFLHDLQRVFGAPLQRIDFRNTALARKAINDWVAKNTRDKIKDIVPEGLPVPDTRLTLANAIHFKANWKNKFSDRATKDADFTRLDATTVTANLMRQVRHYPYADLGEAHAVEIPYKGNATSMVVLLPKKRGDLASLEAALCAGRLAGWETKLTSRRVDLELPKFEFTWAKELGKTLGDLGMPLAFDGKKADFSGMTEAEKIWIGAVLHKAFVAVDEEGTEAAAATVLMLRGRAAPSGKPIEVHADHPFVFLIRHRPTGTILFMGRVTDPNA